MSSVADPGCLSRIHIFFHLGSRIQQNKRIENFLIHCRSLPLFVAINFTKLKLFNFLHSYRKYFSQFTQNLIIFNPQIVTKLLEIYVRSRIRKKPILDPRYRGQKSTGSGSAAMLMRLR